MAKYTLKQNLSLDGKFYGFGSVVELTKAQAEQFAEIVEGAPADARVAAPVKDMSVAAPAETEEVASAEEAPAAEGIQELTKAQLIERLEELGVEFDPNAKKADLVALLEGAAK